RAVWHLCSCCPPSKSFASAVCIGCVRKIPGTPPEIRAGSLALGVRKATNPQPGNSPSQDQLASKRPPARQEPKERVSHSRRLSSHEKPPRTNPQQPTATTLTDYHFVKRSMQTPLKSDRGGDAVHRQARQRPRALLPRQDRKSVV